LQETLERVSRLKDSRSHQRILSVKERLVLHLLKEFSNFGALALSCPSRLYKTVHSKLGTQSCEATRPRDYTHLHYPSTAHRRHNAVSALIRDEVWRNQRQDEVARLSKADCRMTAIVLNSIQTSFLNGRMLDLSEPPAQSGRGLQFSCLTGTQPGARCPRSEKSRLCVPAAARR